MKFRKKLLLAALVPTAVLGSVSCSANDTNSNSSAFEPAIAQRYTGNLLTDEGLTRLKSETTDQSSVDSFIDMIISKGGEAITGGIQVYAKYIVLNLLKECGIDLRDATTKTLEKIQQQLGIIETKIDAIAAKQEKYAAESILNPILQTFTTAHTKYMNYAVGSLGYLAELENNPDLTEPEIEKARQSTYDDGINALLVDGAPLATYVTNLAKIILTPNTTALNTNIFTYFDRTIGSYDKWTIQYYKDIKNFIAYIDSTLIMLSNLAKFQIYYKAKNVDEGIRIAYSGMIDDMAIAVNQVNKLFADKLSELNYIKYDWERFGINTYIATNEPYSIKMATLTYDLDDVSSPRDGDSRQGLLVGYTNSSGTHGCLQVAYAYQPNQDIVKAVANDFQDYAGSYCGSSYTIQDYLEYAGFWATNMDLFRNAAGLFNGDLYVDCHGFLHDDIDYSLSYYDTHGNYQRKNAFEVVSYHTWCSAVDHTELRANDKNYYLCFGRKNTGNYSISLDGKYQRTYMHDCMFTVEEKVYYKYPYMDLYEKTGPIGYRNTW